MKFRTNFRNALVSVAILFCIISKAEQVTGQKVHVVVDNGASCGALCDYTATLEGLCPADTVSTIVWSNGQKGPKVTGLCPNTQYWVKVNGPCVCDSISFRTPLTIKLTLAQNCDRVWANVLGGRYPYTFKWVSNNPQYSLWDWKGNNLTLGNLPNLPDNYSVTVTDAFGCTATASINVKPFTLNVQLSKKNSTCEQDNGSITATVSGANPPFQYEWKRGGSGQQWTTAKVDNIQAGTYFLTVTDKLGCQKTDYIVVMNDGKPTTLTVDTISCRSIRLPWGDSASTSGIYTHKLSGVCDTTLVWNVSISQTLIGDTTSVVICEGGSVAWNNSIYNKTGIYSYTTSTNNGCPVVNYFKLNVLNGSKTVVFNQTTCNSVLADSIEVISASTLDGCSYDSVVVWKYLRPNVNVIWLEDCKKHADSIIVGSGLCPDTTIYRWNVFTINPVIIQRTTCDAKTPASWTVSGFTLSGCPIDTMIVSIYDIPTTKTRWISDCIAHKDSIVIGAGLCPDTMIYKWNYVPILPILKYDTTCNRSVPGTWKATGFNSNGCQVDTIHFTHYTIPSISVKWLNDCKVRKDSVVIGSGLCPDTIVYRWNLIPISNIYVYDTTCNQNVPSTWKATGFTSSGCPVDTIHITTYDLPKSKTVWLNDCKVHKDSLVIGSGLCPDTIVYRWNLIPGITLEKSEKICYGEKWIAPDGTSIEVTNTVTFTTTLSGTNGQCDTTVTFIINPLFGDTITTTLTPVCDSLTAAKGTYSIIIPGNSCPILIHYITQWIPAPTIALDLVDTITCQSGGKIIAHASGNNTFINWQRNGQTLKITDTIAQDLGPGFYTLTAFDMQTGCETSASVELFAPKCETTTDTLPCRWRVFPNPAFEDQPLTLEIEGWGNGEFEITFISPDGGSVSSSKHQGTVGNQIISLNPPPAGVWILSLKNSTKCISGKIVIN